ncbi:MAG: Lrp/AsnC ligand binding domain-containing protein [Thiohalomonadaceae bacterium]
MVTAIVLIKVQRQRVNEVAAELSDLPGISEVYSVGGRYDLVAIVRVPSNEAMADMVTHDLLKVEGIVDTETLLAFKAHSRHDLERMFSIGA